MKNRILNEFCAKLLQVCFLFNLVYRAGLPKVCHQKRSGALSCKGGVTFTGSVRGSYKHFTRNSNPTLYVLGFVTKSKTKAQLTGALKLILEILRFCDEWGQLFF